MISLIIGSLTIFYWIGYFICYICVFEKNSVIDNAFFITGEILIVIFIIFTLLQERINNKIEKRKLRKQAIKAFNDAFFISMPKDEPVIITWNSKNFKNKIHRDLPRDSKGRFVKRSK